MHRIGAGPHGDHDFDYCRDDLSGFFNNNGIANPDIFAAQFVFVVKRGAADGAARNQDWLQFGHRRECAGPADLDGDRLQLRLNPLGGVLVCHCPAGRFRRRAELELLLAAIDLDDDAVDLEGEIVAMLVPSLDECLDLLDVAEDAALRIEREAELLEKLVGLRLRVCSAAALGGASSGAARSPWSAAALGGVFRGARRRGRRRYIGFRSNQVIDV